MMDYHCSQAEVVLLLVLRQAAYHIMCCYEAPHLLGEVANPLLLMLEYQPQPLTQLPTALKAKTMWNMVMVVFLTRLSLEASGSKETDQKISHQLQLKTEKRFG